MPDTREQIIERMAEVIRDVQAVRFVSPLHRELAGSVLPIVVGAVTDQVRSAIDEVVFDLSFDDRTRVVAVDDLLPVLDQIDAELGGK